MHPPYGGYRRNCAIMQKPCDLLRKHGLLVFIKRLKPECCDHHIGALRGQVGFQGIGGQMGDFMRAGLVQLFHSFVVHACGNIDGRNVGVGQGRQKMRPNLSGAGHQIDDCGCFLWQARYFAILDAAQLRLTDQTGDALLAPQPDKPQRK